MGFKTCSMFVKVGLFLCAFALVFSSVASFSPYWMISKTLKTELGVFFKCTDGSCTSDDSSDPEPWQKALAVMESLGLVCAMPCLLFAVLFIFVPQTSGKKWVRIAITVFAFGAATFIIVGTIICATRKNDFPEFFPGFRPSFDLGWSFALAIIGGLLFFTTGICFTLDAIFKK